MSFRLAIHSRGESVELARGKYKIDVLGGWGVRLGDFSMSFRHGGSQQVVNCEKTSWRVQSFVSHIPAKRIFVVNIDNPGIYTVEFSNPGSLQVRPSGLFIVSCFQKPISNELIEVFIN
jgi:hypothetical protein